MCYVVDVRRRLRVFLFFFFQAEDGIRDRSPSRGLGDVYKRQLDGICCMAGNTSVIQNDINLFPDCRMNDGMVDIAVIEPVKTVQLLPTVITAALDPAGKVLGRPQFKIIQTKEAKITCTPSLGMQFDGEIISSNSGVFGARALPQCLDLIVDEFSPLGK